MEFNSENFTTVAIYRSSGEKIRELRRQMRAESGDKMIAADVIDVLINEYNERRQVATACQNVA